MKITVSDVTQADKPQWEALYQAYAAFYNMPMTRATLDIVWSWITDNNHPFYAFIAKNEKGDALGLAHCRAMPSPLRGAMVGFLDDLYVAPESRGTGCVQALYQALNAQGQRENWPFIRWITAEDNNRARASYGKIAQKTHWLTYQMAVE
ncbi:MAG: GNAT family N-acetyltransferase [Arenicellales bacterium]